MKRTGTLFLLFIMTLLPAGVARDITFLVCSDTHYGQDQWADNEALNKAAIDRMNAIAGTAYPTSVGGTVDVPRGVLVTGDLTDSGTWANWSGYWFLYWRDGFVDDYGVNGGGRIDFPVYEGFGNHDIHSPATGAVLDGIRDRNAQRPGLLNISSNGLHYSFEWDGVHFVNLNLYPGGAGDAAESLDFLVDDLNTQLGGSNRPVIVYHHYGFDAFSTDWWTQAEREAYFQVIEGYNVIATFHGHIHNTMRRIWNGIDTYNVGSAKDQKFFVVHITDEKIVVAVRSNDNWGNVWTREFGPFPDAKINGSDGPVSIPQWSTIHFRVSLDPRNEAGGSADYWVSAAYEPPSFTPWWWSYPGAWTQSTAPVRAFGGPMLTIDNYLVASSQLPAGAWEFTFAVDSLDNIMQRSYPRRYLSRGSRKLPAWSETTYNRYRGVFHELRSPARPRRLRSRSRAESYPGREHR